MKALGRVVRWLLCVGWLVPLISGLWIFTSTAINMLEYMAGTGKAGWPPQAHPEVSMATEQFAFLVAQPLIAFGCFWLAIVVCVLMWRSTSSGRAASA